MVDIGMGSGIETNLVRAFIVNFCDKIFDGMNAQDQAPALSEYIVVDCADDVNMTKYRDKKYFFLLRCPCSNQWGWFCFRNWLMHKPQWS